MTKNMFTVVNSETGIQFLAENKNKYLLPISSPKAMCVLLNYVLRNQDVPNEYTDNWWEKEKYQEYYEENDF